MSRIYNERAALKEYIDWLKEERRKLADEYWNAIARLRELDEAQESATTGTNDLIVTMLELIDKQNETADKLADLIPDIPVEAAIAQLNPDIVVEEQEKELIPKELILEEQERAERNAPVRRTKYQSTETFLTEIVGLLKEKQRPVKSAEIKEYLNGKGYNVGNVSSVINRVMEKEPRIKRAHRGYYQFIQ